MVDWVILDMMTMVGGRDCEDNSLSGRRRNDVTDIYFPISGEEGSWSNALSWSGKPSEKPVPAFVNRVICQNTITK
jgi:hypothetical protein